MRTIEQTTQEILELASKHFNVPAGTLAPDDDFFRKLGIDSLQTLELLSRLEQPTMPIAVFSIFPQLRVDACHFRDLSQ